MSNPDKAYEIAENDRINSETQENLITEHTKGKWTVIRGKKGCADQVEDCLIVTEDRQHIAETFQYRNTDNNAADGTSIANARRICLTHNSHDALVRALRKYGDHSASCYRYLYGGYCSCGYEEALKQADIPATVKAPVSSV